MHRILLAALVLLGGCSQPRNGLYRDVDVSVEVESQPQITAMLKASQTTQKFVMGSMLIWNDKVSAHNVQKVIVANNHRRNIQKRILDERHAGVIADGGADLLVYLIERDELHVARAQSLEALTRSRAANWFENRLSSIKGSFDPDRSRDVFDFYCQAKLWERAIDPAVIAIAYRRRPTPLLVCEEIFKKHQLMEYGGSEECTPSDSAKNYLKCLWNDGVLKTPLFSQYRYGNDEVARKQFESLDSALLQANIVWDPTLKTKILQQKKLRLFAEKGSEVPVMEIELAAKAALANFADDSVFSMIFNLENRRKRFFVVDEQANEMMPELGHDLALLARPTTAVSVNEYWFNFPWVSDKPENLLIPSQSDLSAATVAFAEIVQAAVPEIDEKIAERSRRIREVSERLRPRISKLNATNCGKNAAENLVCLEQAAQLESTALARQEEIGKALFTNMTLTLVPAGDGSLCAELRFDERESQEIRLCSVNEGDFRSHSQGTLTVDSVMNVLRLEFTLSESDLTMIGSGNTREGQENGALNFNDMSRDEWLESSITIELTSQAWLSDVKDVELSKLLNGRVFANRDSKKIWNGSMFFRESEPESQKNFESIAELVLSTSSD